MPPYAPKPVPIPGVNFTPSKPVVWTIKDTPGNKIIGQTGEGSKVNSNNFIPKSGGTSRSSGGGSSSQQSPAPTVVIQKSIAPVPQKPSASINVSNDFWNKVTVGEIKASGYKDLTSWKEAYKKGQAPAPPSSIGNSFRIDSKTGSFVDSRTGAIKPNVKQQQEFDAIKNRVVRRKAIEDFANKGGGQAYGELTAADKAQLKERGFEAKKSFYDSSAQRGGEFYDRINQGSLQSAPAFTQAVAITAQKVAETPSIQTKTVNSPLGAGLKSVGVDFDPFTTEVTLDNQRVYVYKGQKYAQAGFNKFVNIDTGATADSNLSKDISTQVMKDASMTFAAGLNIGGGGAVKGVQAAGSTGFSVLRNIFGGQAVKETVKVGAKEAVKQRAKTSATSIAKEFAKTFGRKALSVAGTKPGRVVTGLGIAVGGNLAGQAAPEGFTQASIGIERTTGSLDLGKTQDEQRKLDLAIARTYEKTKNRFEGYIEETQDASGKTVATTKKGEGDQIALLATQLVPGARLFTKYKDIWGEELVPALKEQGFTEAQISKNKDAIVRSYLAARQTGATIGNVAVEIGGELGFRRLASGALKTPKITGVKSGIGYGLKLGALSTPFGGMEGYSQDVIESNATFRKRDAGRELQSAIWGSAISGGFNFSTGVAMGAGKRISQAVGKSKTPSSFKKGAELGAKTVTTIGYLADAPGEFIGDKSSDVIENFFKVSKKNVVNVPKGRVSTIGFGSSLNTVSKGNTAQQTKNPKVQTSNILQGLFGGGKSQATGKGGGTTQNTLGLDTKGNSNTDTKGNNKNNNTLDLGNDTSTDAQNETEQNTKQDSSVSTQAQATDTVSVNVMSPAGRVGGFPFLPFGGSGKGSRRTRGTIRNELAEAFGSMGLRTRQEVNVGTDYLKKFNRLRR